MNASRGVYRFLWRIHVRNLNMRINERVERLNFEFVEYIDSRGE